MTAVRSRWRWTPAGVAVLVIAWALLVGMILLESGLAAPRSAVEWLLLCIAGPPAYLALERFGRRIAEPRPGATQPPGLSLKRILIGTLVGAAWVALLVWWGASHPR